MHKWLNEHGNNPKRLCQVVEYRVKPTFIGFILCEQPRRCLVNVFVGSADESPDFLQGDAEVELVHVSFYLCGGAQGKLLQFAVGALIVSRRRNHSIVVFFYHGDGAADQVAQVVGQIGIHAVEHDFVCKQSVIPEGVLSQQEIFQGVHAVTLDEFNRIYNIPSGFGHLSALQEDPTVAQDLFRKRKLQGHEHCRPNDGVEPNNFLPDEMHVRRPIMVVFHRIIRITESGDIVGKRIQPHVNYMLFVDGNGNAPVEGGPGNTQIFQPLPREAEHFVPTAFRLEKFRVVFKEVDQLVLIFGKAEEIRLLLGFLNGSAAVRAFAFLRLSFGPKRLAGRAVPAFVFTFVNVTLLIHFHEEFLDPLHVALFRGPDEIVVGYLHGLPQLLDAVHYFVHVFLRRAAVFLRYFLYFLPMLVGACQEHDVIAGQTLEARHGICHNGAIGVPDMQV